MSRMQLRYDMVQCFVIRPGGAEATGDWQVLQLRRRPADYMGGTWQTVFGGIEPGETAVAAALRELAEETGLRPVEFYQLDYVNIFYVAASDTMWHVPCFCAVVEHAAEVRLDGEHDDWRWLAQRDAERHMMWRGDRLALAELREQILGDSAARAYLRIGI